ncbi:hypothetical protein M752DRAFT_19480 [Aspergillus phoenicis ATCC 13157]|uniref:Uncharacterized protein n=1 Tax=Aspergillus phoenicis ATCC 13157 TaxID=1353007 RepID=A0A370PHT0_ASPPH|nr:hypothetical protein M752DRAFT_19480 [Aspergillus phoenicis ATCC 13157]
MTRVRDFTHRVTSMISNLRIGKLWMQRGIPSSPAPFCLCSRGTTLLIFRCAIPVWSEIVVGVLFQMPMIWYAWLSKSCYCSFAFLSFQTSARTLGGHHRACNPP